MVNGHTFASYPVEGYVPQESVLRPILWNVYFNDLLQSILSASAYADDYTLSWTYEKEETQAVVVCQRTTE